MDIDAAFKLNTSKRRTKDGYSVKCKLGLWAVTAPTEQEALREAKHCFAQYFDDGEYGL